MTGLFRRLARQVVGPQPTKVHALTKLPFVPPPEPLAPVEADDVGTTHAPLVASTSTAGQTTENIHTTAPASTAHTPKASPAPAQATPPEPVTHDDSAAVSTAAEAARGKGRRPAPAFEHPQAAVQAEPTGNARKDDGTAAAPDAAQTPAVNRHRAAEPADVAVSAPVTVNEPDMNIPPPLVNSPGAATQAPDATAGEPARPTARDSRESRAETTPTPASEPTEVHVHIGRIEVTAVAEAAPTRSRPRTGKAPMSLEQYLARRERGRP